MRPATASAAQQALTEALRPTATGRVLPLKLLNDLMVVGLEQ